jgi:ornithine carbamoyltransferase
VLDQVDIFVWGYPDYTRRATVGFNGSLPYPVVGELAVAGKTLAFIGDTASNMGRSFTEGAKLYGYQLRLASPKGYHPAAEVVTHSPDHVHLLSDPKEAVRGADVVITDVWTSMGQEAESKQRLADLAGFQVDGALMKLAKPDAMFLHCLPAHRGEEVSADVIDGPQSAVWDEAENRLHVQKALLETVVQASERLRKMAPALRAARG